MRKIIFSILVLMIIGLILGPFAAGLWFQKSYRELISFYNSKENMNIVLLDYQRGWFSSTVTLQIQGVTLKQHVQHGPLFYNHSKNLPLFGIAAVQDKINLPPELMPDVQIQSATVISFLGNYCHAFKITGFALSDSDQEVKVSIEDIVASFSIFPSENRLNIEAEFTNSKASDEDRSLVMPHVIVKINLSKFNLSVINNLLIAYGDFLQSGEVYQGQLKQKFMMLLPKIVTPGSAIELAKLNIIAPRGNILAKGIFEWPEKDFLQPSDLRDLVMTGQAQIEMSVSKKVMMDLIHLSSTMPDFIRDVAEPQRNKLLAARDEMEFALQRNALFIAYLSDRGYVSKQAEDSLMEMQKNFVNLEDYTKVVKDLFLDRQLSLVVSYQLCWQYAQIIKPYQFLEGRVVEFQKIAEKQIGDIFNGFVKKGYVSEKDGDYVAIIKWSEKGFSSNNIDIK